MIYTPALLLAWNRGDSDFSYGCLHLKLGKFCNKIYLYICIHYVHF